MIDIAIEAALKAGEKILEIYAQDFEVEFKADDSPLTSADRASNELIMEALEPTGIPILSEENKAIAYADRKGWDQFWLVDPIDGTKEFIKKNGEFTVNIALVQSGAPVIGVVYAPVLETLYWGDSGGAWKAEGCRGKSLDEIQRLASVLRIDDQQSEIGNLKVVASRSHCSEETVAFIEALETKYGPAERVSMGSSLKLCLVAEGAADIYPRIAPTMEWDTAAADAVVRGAGGAVYEYNSVVHAHDYTTGSKKLTLLNYNKENLLNPYFVVSGLYEKS